MDWLAHVAAVVLAVVGTPVPPEEVLAHEPPYLGVACRTPNSNACDRVGLAVWLRAPAQSVEARIGDTRFALDDDRWPDDARGEAHIGYLQPAGRHDEEPEAVIDLRITTRDGRVLTTREHVDLHAGWG